MAAISAYDVGKKRITYQNDRHEMALSISQDHPIYEQNQQDSTPYDSLQSRIRILFNTSRNSDNVLFLPHIRIWFRHYTSISQNNWFSYGDYTTWVNLLSQAISIKKIKGVSDMSQQLNRLSCTYQHMNGNVRVCADSACCAGGCCKLCTCACPGAGSRTCARHAGPATTTSRKTPFGSEPIWPLVSVVF